LRVAGYPVGNGDVGGVSLPNRILKESICTSDTICQLTWFEEVLFYRLIVNCDDYGRFDGRSPVLKGRLFPLETNVTEKTIDKSIQKLSTVGLVMPYQYDGKPILQLVTWDNHQTVRNKRSKYPAVNGSDTLSSTENMQLITSASTCKQLKSIEIKCPRNPIQSESNPNPIVVVNARDDHPNPPQDESVSKLIRLFAEINGETNLNSVVGDGIAHWCGILGHELTEYAINHCAKSGRKPWGYLEKVLISWHEQGFKTVADVEDHEQKRTRQNREPPSTKPINPKYSDEALDKLAEMPYLDQGGKL
jgi:DnaD/phage-associated family protein